MLKRGLGLFFKLNFNFYITLGAGGGSGGRGEEEVKGMVREGEEGYIGKGL